MKLKDVFHGGTGLLVAAAVIGLGPVAAVADNEGAKAKPSPIIVKARPSTFVGIAGKCGGGYPAGSRIVTARWINGLGLPDNGGANVGSDPTDNPNKSDPHSGLLLSKNGTTPDCSAAQAEIQTVAGLTVTSTFALGFDYRNGGHCGAGAPRFDVDTDMGFFFVGCANAPQSAAPPDGLQWTRTRSVLTTCGAECFPGPVPVGAKIKSISIVFDEGTDTANNDTQGVGLAVIDNIFINGVLITDGGGEQERNGERQEPTGERPW